MRQTDRLEFPYHSNMFSSWSQGAPRRVSSGRTLLRNLTPKRFQTLVFEGFFGRPPHIVSGPGIGETRGSEKQFPGKHLPHVTTDCGPDLVVQVNISQRALSDTSELRCTQKLHFKMHTVMPLWQVGWSQSGGLAQLQSETSDVIHDDPIHAESLERVGTCGVDCRSFGGDVMFPICGGSPVGSLAWRGSEGRGRGGRGGEGRAHLHAPSRGSLNFEGFNSSALPSFEATFLEVLFRWHG